MLASERGLSHGGSPGSHAALRAPGMGSLHEAPRQPALGGREASISQGLLSPPLNGALIPGCFLSLPGSRPALGLPPLPGTGGSSPSCTPQVLLSTLFAELFKFRDTIPVACAPCYGQSLSPKLIC